MHRFVFKADIEFTAKDLDEAFVKLSNHFLDIADADNEPRQPQLQQTGTFDLRRED